MNTVNTSTTPIVASGPSSGCASVRASVRLEASAKPNIDVASPGELSLPMTPGADWTSRRRSKLPLAVSACHLSTTVAW